MATASPEQHQSSPIRDPHSSPESPTSLSCCFCCCGGRSPKIQPALGTYPGYDLLEIRPGRHLRIIHLNPRKREERFQDEMEKFMAAQVRSGKYGTHGKSWNIPQPGRMDQQNASPEQAPKHSNGGVQLESYQSYHDQDTGQSYRGEDNLSFRADSPELEKQMKKALSRESSGQSNFDVRKGSVRSGKRSRHSSTNTDDDGNGTLVLGSPTFIRGARRVDDPRAGQELANISTTTAENIVVDVNFEQKLNSDNNIPKRSVSLDNTTPPPKILDPAKEQTVIFFIHGVGGSSAIWQAQADHFMREGYEVVLPDFIGHGFSCTPEDPQAYHFQEIAADLLVIFDLYCKRKNMVVGHSYGSSFATVLARLRSRLVTQLVMVSGGSPTPLAPQPGTFSAPMWILNCFKPLLDRGFRRSAFHGKKSHALMGRAFDIPTHVLKHTMNGQVWLAGGEDYHRLLTAKTLLIYGRQDKLVTCEETHEMDRVLSDSILEVIEGASHMVMMEQPELVNNLLHRFLINKLKRQPTSPHASETDFKRVSHSRASIRSNQSMNNSRASLRSHKSVPSGLVAGNLN